MFKKLLNSLNDIINQQRESQKERLASFNDDFVYQIEWSPNKNGGTSFKTRSFKRLANGNIKFSASPQVLLFLTVPVLVGLGLFHFVLAPHMPVSNYLLHPIQSFQAWYFMFTQAIPIEKQVACGMGALFFLIGAIGFYKMLRPNVFTVSLQKYRFGYSWSKPVIISFNDIKAVQIISEYCSGGEGGGFRSYELNLVLKDKTRHTITDHGNAVEIRNAAKAISTALSIPVWDLTNPVL